MPSWLQIVLALGGSAIISTTISCVLKRAFSKATEKADLEAEANRQRQIQEQKEFDLLREEAEKRENIAEIKKIINEAIQPISEDLNEIKKTVTHNTKTDVCLLRDALMTNYYKCLDKGFRTNWDTQNFDDLFQDYSASGGNSFICDVKTRFLALPVKDAN